MLLASVFLLSSMGKESRKTEATLRLWLRRREKKNIRRRDARRNYQFKIILS